MSETRIYVEAAVHPSWGAPEEAMGDCITNKRGRKVPDENKGKLRAKYTVTKKPRRLYIRVETSCEYSDRFTAAQQARWGAINNVDPPPR